ncbi:hypothetical protein ACFL1H_06795 [Nanoarchaeota archaeon]
MIIKIINIWKRKKIDGFGMFKGAKPFKRENDDRKYFINNKK